MVSGCIIVESLRVGTLLEVGGLRMTRLSRQDVSSGATPAQPTVWTLVNFEADDAVADELAASLLAEGGWYADFRVGDDHVVVFADKVFRYRRGDLAGRGEATTYGASVGVPPHQLDWGD